MSVPAQIAVLVALSADLFDTVPLDQMPDAEHAVREAAANIPEEICAQFETAADLNDGGRTTMLEIARLSLAKFRSRAEPEPRSEARTRVKPAPKEKS